MRNPLRRRPIAGTAASAPTDEQRAQGVVAKLRQLMIGFNAQGSKREEMSELRRVALGVAAVARKPGELVRTIKGIGEAAEFHAAEAASWLTTAQIVEGASGPFDACDLTAWLAIADKAGVAAVPAREILRLTEEEYEAVCGFVENLTGPVPDRIRKTVAAAIETDRAEFDAMLSDETASAPAPIDRETLHERLFSCLDAVPEGWMVRPSCCGTSELKALAGTGLAGDTAPEVRFGSDLSVGPGWIRNGNRRRVNTGDRRIMKAHASGPHRGAVFLARPWVEASRWIVCDDPHRHGSPVQGPGRWPMEWRAFVRGGVVEGVSVYYAWTGSATPENARVALQVRELAQRMVDAAIVQSLEPRLMDLQHARRNAQLAEMLDEKGFGEGSFACTLDFIETKDGLMLLEGGPGHTPLGGGHCCGFAGTSGKPTMGNPMETVGVAFRPMAHVLIGEMDTWSDGDRTDAILPWADVEALAARD